MRTVCDKRLLDGRRSRAVRGATAGEKYNAPDVCVHGAFNVESLSGKVARVASEMRHS